MVVHKIDSISSISPRNRVLSCLTLSWCYFVKTWKIIPENCHLACLGRILDKPPKKTWIQIKQLTVRQQSTTATKPKCIDLASTITHKVGPNDRSWMSPEPGISYDFVVQLNFLSFLPGSSMLVPGDLTCNVTRCYKFLGCILAAVVPWKSLPAWKRDLLQEENEGFFSRSEACVCVKTFRTNSH